MTREYLQTEIKRFLEMLGTRSFWHLPTDAHDRAIGALFHLQVKVGDEMTSDFLCTAVNQYFRRYEYVTILPPPWWHTKEVSD